MRDVQSGSGRSQRPKNASFRKPTTPRKRFPYRFEAFPPLHCAWPAQRNVPTMAKHWWAPLFVSPYTYEPHTQATSYPSPCTHTSLSLSRTHALTMPSLPHKPHTDPAVQQRGAHVAAYIAQTRTSTGIVQHVRGEKKKTHKEPDKGKLLALSVGPVIFSHGATARLSAGFLGQASLGESYPCHATKRAQYTMLTKRLCRFLSSFLFFARMGGSALALALFWFVFVPSCVGCATEEWA